MLPESVAKSDGATKIDTSSAIARAVAFIHQDLDDDCKIKARRSSCFFRLFRDKTDNQSYQFRENKSTANDNDTFYQSPSVP